MNEQLLVTTAHTLLSKGILAMDESIGTCNKRFAKLDIPQTPEARRDWRELIVTTPQLNTCISGAILFEATLHQQMKNGMPIVDKLIEEGIVLGIKVDKGTIRLAGHPLEKTTKGLDGLKKRLKNFQLFGVQFTKWRAVIKIGEELPSKACIAANAHALARYAAICQEAGLVPMVEPEVLMSGYHDLEHCFEVSEEVQHQVFKELYTQGVLLEGLILKPNMITSGTKCHKQATVNEVADATMKCLRRTVPPAVAGIAFLSGGQSSQLAFSHLGAMHSNDEMAPAWPLTFSFSRAIQQEALDIWKGKDENIEAAQQKLYDNANCALVASRITPPHS